MFTGIVAEAGEVDAVESGAEGARLRIRTGLASELAAGDSISVNGVCLTAARVEGGVFEADAMHQTLKLTTLGELEVGSPVNLELALLPTDRMGGPVVQGHVDGTASRAAFASSCPPSFWTSSSSAARSRSTGSASPSPPLGTAGSRSP